MRLVFVHVDEATATPTERALSADEATVEPTERALSADEATVEPTERALSGADGVDGDGPAALEVTDGLVAFVAVESGDGTDVGGVVVAAADAVREVAERLRVDDVLLYPDAAASPRAAAPASAAPVFGAFVDALGDEAFDVRASPFGWRARLEVETKAHPFATTVRSVGPGDAAEPPSTDWRLVGSGGDGRDPARVLDDDEGSGEEGSDDDGSSGDDLLALSPGAERVVRAVVDDLESPGPALASSGGDAPPDRGDRARALAVADRDPLDAAATRRPVGAFLRDALADAVADLGSTTADATMPVGGPRALDLADDGVRGYAATLGTRSRGVPAGDRRVLLSDRDAATALATLAAADVPADAYPLALSTPDAPAALANEWVENVYGRDGQGDADGVDALAAGSRAPTVHEAFAPDGANDADGPADANAADAVDAAARDAVVEHAGRSLALAADCGLDALAVVRVTPAFATANAGWLDDLGRALDAPVLVGVVDGGPTAWPVRVDVLAPTADGGALPTGTVRLDDDGVAHFEEDDDPVPSVVHASPAGALDATLAAILDAPAVAAAEAADGAGRGAVDPTEVPATPLPDWLAATQLRLVPVADDHVARAADAADALSAAGVRVDVDDRELSVGARIAAVERERVPRYVVVGDDERAGAELPVTDAATGRTRARSVEEIAEAVDAVRDAVREAVDAVPEAIDAAVDAETADRPRRPRPLARRLARRPRFDVD
ncbi:hypothetical protein G9C85_07230 [Halorubellus sp. JP-L1]|uniref:threonyl-tRNA synthetase editing domain-containing protein n=1 Tax=Halorubellus sp. JP-L1 TaxID=2715753 RepID=UPI00140B047E|nr:threonyl-tRNA synthetase editing domain-containing protein [Halorubellus sp. JP-L1]NHN41429.1 hypothetical protein [Halorubellus sp. JP-L1]